MVLYILITLSNTFTVPKAFYKEDKNTISHAPVANLFAIVF